MFQHFGQRLKRDLKQLVDHRLEASAISSGSAQKVSMLRHLDFVALITL
jgi:actin-related protein 3